MKHIHLVECQSTQDVLKEQLLTTPTESVLVSCDLQTQGRGRGQNTWLSLPGTLCLSMNLKAHSKPSFTALEISVLIARFIEEKGVNLLLKWPNDLWDKNHLKCCGVLIQSSQEQMLTGIGLNLFSSLKDFGAVFSEDFEVDKKVWSADLAGFIQSHRYQRTEDLISDWEKKCFHLNQAVTITEGSEVSQGIFRGLGEHGEALLESGTRMLHLFNGTLRPVT
jgi:BirA family transcriptional regulator, biotin operon repressor / biotin---[acetyl-CoA-carboxylase] ligase